MLGNLQLAHGNVLSSYLYTKNCIERKVEGKENQNQAAHHEFEPVGPTLLKESTMWLVLRPPTFYFLTPSPSLL